MGILLGKNIEKLRSRMYLTQEDLARECRVAPKMVRDWEDGIICPDMYSVPELLEALGSEAKDVFKKGDKLYFDEKASTSPDGIIIKIESAEAKGVSLNLPVEVIRSFLASGDLCASVVLNNTEALKYMDWDRVLNMADLGLLGEYTNEVSSKSGKILMTAETVE